MERAAVPTSNTASRRENGQRGEAKRVGALSGGADTAACEFHEPVVRALTAALLPGPLRARRVLATRRPSSCECDSLKWPT
jgi:hypothetical protein